jgi:hypothetical protein
MKVNVLQNTDIQFDRFRWWSSWIDICIYDHGCDCWLVQMRISRRNRKQFKVTRIAKYTNSFEVSDLTQMTRET